MNLNIRYSIYAGCLGVEQSKTFSILGLIALGVLAVASVFASLTTKVSFPSSGSIKSVGLGVYSDRWCRFTLSTLEFGELDPGSSQSFTLYLKNVGNSELTLSMTSENWNPVNAPDYMLLSWNRDGYTIDPGESVSCEITLSISNSIQGIDAFSLDIVLAGTG